MVRVISQIINSDEEMRSWGKLIAYDVKYRASIDTATPPTLRHVVDSIECETEEEAIALLEIYNPARENRAGITLREALAKVRRHK